MEQFVTEGTKLIAEFMGATSLPYLPFNIRDAEYHTNWNWLMPVVQKIRYEYRKQIEWFQFFGTDEDENEFTGEYWCQIHNDLDYHRKHTPMVDITGVDSEIQAVWLAVVEFIKWYNDNKRGKRKDTRRSV